MYFTAIVLSGFALILIIWAGRGRASQDPVVDPSVVQAKSEGVRLRKTKWSSVPGTILVTKDRIIFQVNLGRVPMSYDARQISVWNLEACSLDLTTPGRLTIVQDNRRSVLANISPTCFNYLVRAMNQKHSGGL